MTAEQQAQWKRVKSAIAINIADWIKAGFTPAEMAEGLLALTGDDGKPLLAVLDPNQDMPLTAMMEDEHEKKIARTVLKAMKEAGWRLVLRPESEVKHDY